MDLETRTRRRQSVIGSLPLGLALLLGTGCPKSGGNPPSNPPAVQNCSQIRTLIEDYLDRDAEVDTYQRDEMQQSFGHGFVVSYAATYTPDAQGVSPTYYFILDLPDDTTCRLDQSTIDGVRGWLTDHPTGYHLGTNVVVITSDAERWRVNGAIPNVVVSPITGNVAAYLQRPSS